MKVKELLDYLNKATTEHPPYLDNDVVVKFEPPENTVGGSPCVGIEGIYPGFDWDSGKFIIYTKESLTLARSKK